MVSSDNTQHPFLDLNGKKPKFQDDIVGGGADGEIEPRRNDVDSGRPEKLDISPLLTPYLKFRSGETLSLSTGKSPQKSFPPFVPLIRTRHVRSIFSELVSTQKESDDLDVGPVSYTHLTLPTILLV